jgi:long-chain fatty acid transport protein
MKHFAVVTAAMLAATSGAYAGGVERSTQSVAILFEQGRYAELNFGRFCS